MISRKLTHTDIDNPGEWNVFQVIRRLDSVDKSKPRVGTSHYPSDDSVRFGQKVTLAFSPNDVASYKYNGDSIPSSMELNCSGTLGSNGPLSLQLTEHVYQRSKHSRDNTFIGFLNMFHNRMAAFLYRAWALYQPAVSCDRKDEDYFLKIFKSLIGHDYTSSQKQQSILEPIHSSKNHAFVQPKTGLMSPRNTDTFRYIEDHASVYYSGLLTKPVQGRGGFVAVLYDYFNVPVKLEQFTGLWDKIIDQYYCKLGLSPFNSTLDGGIAMGEKHWDCKKKFKIKMGPMSYKKYASFLPGKPAFKHLVEWVKKFNISHYEWELQLVLKADEVPLCGTGTLLGYTGWMTSKKNLKDREDLIIVKPMEKRLTRQ